ICACGAGTKKRRDAAGRPRPWLKPESLERNLGAHFQDAVAAVAARAVPGIKPGAGNAAKVAAGYVDARAGELRRVGHAEGLQFEFHAHVFANREMTEHRRVEIKEA